MIYYQLPNGKAVFLTVNQLLNLSDEDIQEIIANDFGQENNNPFVRITDNSIEEEYYELDLPEMLSDGDDQIGNIDINQIPDEESESDY